MDKWDYIEEISDKNMIYQLLEWANAFNTRQVSLNQAKEFYNIFLNPYKIK